MINPGLLGYIRSQLALNVSKEVITNNLKTQGWTDADVGEAFAAIAPAPAPVAAPGAFTPTPVASATTLAGPTISEPLISTSSSVHAKAGGKKIILAGLVAVLCLGGGAYAYNAGLLNFGKAETFQQVFSKALDKISSQEYSKTITKASITLKDEKTIAQLNLPAGAYPQINFSSDAVLHRKDLNDFSKNKASVSAKFNLINVLEDPISSEIDFLVTEPMVFYIKLTELTGLPEGAPSLSASLFQGKWWKIDVKTLIENFAALEADKLLESFEDNQPSKEELEKINAILKKYLAVAQVEKLEDGVIDGSPAFHFSVNFNKEQYAEMLMEMFEVSEKKSIDGIEITMSDIKAGIQTALNFIDIGPIEIFVKKVGYVPFEVKFSLGVLNAKGESIADINVNYVTSPTKSVNIQAPAESTDILYLMGPIVQSSLGSARQKGKEAAIKARMSNLRAEAELFWDKNYPNEYSGFCSSKELRDGKTAIESDGGTGFVCKENKKAYAIAVNFAEKTSGGWCVDSTGVSRVVKTLPSGTVCPLE